MKHLTYQAPKFTTAQLVLMACGVDDLRLMSHHHEGRGNASFTKKGPGRRAAIGKAPSATAPKAPSGAFGLKQHTNPGRHAQRAAMAALGGRRQFIKAKKAERAFDRAQGVAL